MSAGVVATPTYQGVTKLPTAAHLRTNLLNGNVRVSSQTNTVGGQPAVYEITGGSITSNVKLALPNVTSDDTLVTQNGNIVWGGGHTFQQGLNANGPLITTSSISGQSISANNMTVTAAFNSGGSITSGDTLNAKNDLIVGGNGNIGGTHTVGSTLTAASSAFQATSTQISHTGDFNFNPTSGPLLSNGVVYSNGHHSIQFKPNTPALGAMTMVNFNGGVSDTVTFGIVTGTGSGLVLGTTTAQCVGFHGGGSSPQQVAHGFISAPTVYNTQAQNMLNDCYTVMRLKGFMN